MRGIPNAGFRRPRGTWKAEQEQKRLQREKIQQAVQAVTKPSQKPKKPESDEQILKRINRQFDTLKQMTTAVCQGNARGLILSGPPGLGKSFESQKIIEKMKKYDPNNVVRKNSKAAEVEVDDEGEMEFAKQDDIIDTNEAVFIKGFIRPTGLYQMMYRHRHKGHVIVLDDCDAVFDNVDALNLLKAGTDTTERRIVSWGCDTKMTDDFGEYLPFSFEFEGSLIFATNLDFLHEIEAGTKRAPHLEALISRCHYIDMEMKSIRDYLVRIRQVIIDEKMLGPKAITPEAQDEIVEYIFENAEKFRELTLRTALKIADLYNINRKTWKSMASVTMFKLEDR